MYHGTSLGQEKTWAIESETPPVAQQHGSDEHSSNITESVCGGQRKRDPQANQLTTVRILDLMTLIMTPSYGEIHISVRPRCRI